jgi:hypothetical protein
MKSQLVKKLLRHSGYAILTLVALLALFILEENLRGRISLAHYKSELRAKGEKLTLEELNLPKPPAKSNGVSALLAAADEAATNSRANPLWWYGLGLPTFTSAGRREVLHQQERLADRRPAPSGSASARRRPGPAEEQPYVPAPPPTCSWDELTKNLAAVSNALENARTAAHEPLLDMNLDYTKGLDRQHLHFEGIRHLQEWLAASAMEALHRENLTRPLDDITTLVALVRLQKDERLVGLQYLRLGTANLGLHVTWEALQDEGWTDQQLTRLQEDWQGAECLPDYIPSLEMNRVINLQAYHRETLKDLVGNNSSSRNRPLDWADYPAYALSFLWRAGWEQQNELCTLNGWQDNLDNARAVVMRKSWMAWSIKPGRQWTLYDRWRYLFGGNYDETFQIHQAVQYETLREMTVAAVALNRYKLRTGTYPASLSVLVPEFLPALPHDWMDGESLHYRLNADGTFTLYSVNDDGIDNGGDPNPPTARTGLQMWAGRDAVWPVAATQDEVEAWKLKRLEQMRRRTELKR